MTSEVLSANPRCNPVCRVCHYKDLPYLAQLARKMTWARKNLGRWSEGLREIVPAPEAERVGYRAKTWMRSEIRDGKVSFGMFRAVQIDGAWKKEFISWDGCPIHRPEIAETLERLGRALARHAPRFSAENLFGVWVGSPHLVIVGRETLPEEIRSLPWNEILEPRIARAWYHRTSQVGRKVFGRGEIIPLNGSAPEAMHPIRAFRQVAQTLVTEARRLAVSSLLAHGPHLVVDLYCGTGELSLLLPKETGWLGIEISPDAAAYANTLRPPEAAPHLAFVGSVEQRLHDPRVDSRISEPYALYVNPPRSGLAPEAREKILGTIRSRAPTSIVYLSCSASSLARDLVDFEREGYRIALLQPYDFFPQTEHFETLAVLEK
jgi:tRNA/tmRNA/rRNA uracil-C5-methylase (TrmA/RlmC/RlmD family)